MEGYQGTQTLYVRGYSSTRIEKSQEETEKILEEKKKAAPNGGFFIPLSFLLRILIFINESVELSDRRLELECLVASFMIIHTKDDCRRNQERIEDEGEERIGGI